MYSFSYLEPVCSMSSSNCCFLNCIQVSQEAGQVVWYSHHFQNFPQFIVIHTVKGFGIVNKAEIDVFLELSWFFNDPVVLTNKIRQEKSIRGIRMGKVRMNCKVQVRKCLQFSSAQFSRSVISDSLRPHESQHTKPLSPSLTTRVDPNSFAWSQWCHPAISSSVFPFSSCPQSLTASRSFPMSQLFVRRGKCIGVSASASVLPMNTQDWSPLGWTGSISLQSKGLSKVFSSTFQKHQFTTLSFLHSPTLTSIHDHCKNQSLD